MIKIVLNLTRRVCKEEQVNYFIYNIEGIRVKIASVIQQYIDKSVHLLVVADWKTI